VDAGTRLVYVYLSKILPLLVMPLSVTLTLAILAVLFLRYEKRLWAMVFLSASVVLLWVASTPIVASALYQRVESTYPAAALEQIPVGDCIVLLGGAVGPPMPPRVDIELNDAIDRVFQAAKLYRAGKGRVIIVTAGNQPWSESRWAEAELIRELLVEWGVPESAVMLEGSSRNTRENAVYSKNIIDAQQCTNTLLVTSAAHMPRAAAAFRSVGVEVTAISTDVRIANVGRLTVGSFIPSAHALAMTSDAIREWIGRWYYSYKGWN
jgi:uncharacterized SAM-binding protein YcdF (DUF218 family)